MRPLKDLFIEEYWDIGYRPYKLDDSVIDGGKKKFSTLKADKRFWYADPYLFEKDGHTYLFVEMFDNITERGLIGVSRFCEGKFTKPEPVLKECFHLSFPIVFEEDGKIFMMPETHEDNCVQLYEAVDFPYKWKKSKVIIHEENAVDTVVYKDKIIVSKVTEPIEMVTHLEIYDRKSGQKYSAFPATEDSQLKRGAGGIFEDSGRIIRPAQNCMNAFYGRGVILYEITKLTETEYREEKTGEIKPENIIAGSPSVTGTHTYSRTAVLEVIDIKRRRFNLKRLFWIIKRKTVN